MYTLGRVLGAKSSPWTCNALIKNKKGDPKGRRFRVYDRLPFDQYAQHAAQGLCGTPQQLIADGKGVQVFIA